MKIQKVGMTIDVHDVEGSAFRQVETTTRLTETLF